MAKATLPTNYKDDIMATPMGGLRRYRPIQNDDGTVSFEDVTDYTQVGSNFGAAQMNQTNTAVNNSADKSRIIDSLADVAANTQAGMMAGALAVRELNGKTVVSIINAYSDRVAFDFSSCYKIGKIVIIQFRVRFTENFPIGVNLFKIGQSEAHPKTTIKLPAMIVNDGKCEIYYVEIHPNGYIQQNIGTSITELSVFGTYII